MPVMEIEIDHSEPWEDFWVRLIKRWGEVLEDEAAEQAQPGSGEGDGPADPE